MKRSEFLKRFGIKLDMAVEAHDLIRGETGREIPGVKMDKQTFSQGEITVINIMEPLGAQIMGKPIGTYITIDAPVIRENNKLAHKEVTAKLAEQLGSILNLKPEDSALLVGLGNWNATPDALGPRVIHYSLATRHLRKYGPQEIFGVLRPVSALAPGVLGITGIETAEIIKGVVDRVQPNLVIAIDALAAQSVERIGTSIQIANTGINPGSGVGNIRAGITQEFLGVPVIAIGVPTVVNAATIAQSVLDQFMQQINQNPVLAKTVANLNPISVDQAIKNVLQPYQENLMVTPKEIDDLINNIGKIIAAGIGQALHPSVAPEDLEMLVH
ncbi:GPR endopeptidase [Thermincola potens]|uniref:Germination protease n=1 Tax=Thermincola potens (strain JR) TaxID=635013 RepID=D5X8R2_THEPJ|nr:GPR endopeptidase [Thermincola potens]ADG82938.1 spore protease [Thermincola potens JR]